MTEHGHDPACDTTAQVETAARGDLREAALAGLRWVTAARAASEVLTFASMIVLAHLIAPAEFGKAAIPLVIQGIGLVLAVEGVGTVLVQRKEIRPEHLQSAVLLSVAIGLALTVIVFALAPVLGSLFGDDVAGLIRIMSPIFLLSGLSVVPQARLQRRLDFRRTSVVELGTVLTRTAVCLALALAGLDAEALTIGTVAGSVVSAGLLIAAVPLGWPRWDRSAGRDIAAFGLPAAGAGLMFGSFRNVDYAIIGARLGVTQLGYYFRSYQLGVEYQRKIGGIMQRLALPIFSRTEDLADMRRIRARVVRTQASVLLPLLATFVALAPELVPWMLGERWTPAVLPSQLLAGVGMIVAVQSSMGAIVLAAGHPRTLLAFGTASTAAYAGVVYVASGYGLTATCLSVLGFHVAQLVAGQYLMLQRLAGIPMRALVPDVAPVLCGCVALELAAWPLVRVLSGSGVPTLPSLAGAAAAGGLVYALVLRLAFTSTWNDLMLVMNRVLPLRELARRVEARRHGERSVFMLGDGQSSRIRQAPRWALVAISVLTCGWLAAQFAAGYSVRNNTWPVTGFGMFRNELDSYADPGLEATTRSGRRVMLAPEDFGLIEDQYERYLVRNVVHVPPAPAHPEGATRLEGLARIYNRRHGGDPVVALTATVVIHPLPGGEPSRRMRLLRWNA
jgi:lipopolysaccharide exporter